MKRKILLTALIFLGLQQFCYRKTAGFRTDKIAFDGTELNTSYPIPASIFPLLDQKFYFLGSGVQCYAFLAEDGKTVLKVFKHYHMWPGTRLLARISPDCSTIKERRARMLSILESCRLAFEEYKEETALLYAHLQVSQEFHKKITLIDKIGIAHEIDLDATLFVLQQRADLIYPYIDHLMQKKNVLAAEEALKNLVALIATRKERGIVNQDPIIHRNFGFIEGKALEIDIGSLRKDPLIKNSSSYKKAFFYETLELKEWVEGKYPELLNSLNNEIETILSS